MEEVHQQFSGGHAAWICHIFNSEEGVQYMAIKTAQGVVGGCIDLKKIFYRPYNPDFILL